MPEYRRMLGQSPCHRDDFGRYLHARLRVLQRQNGQTVTGRRGRTARIWPKQSRDLVSNTSLSPRLTATIWPMAVHISSCVVSRNSGLPRRPETTIEILTPDFLRKKGAIEAVAKARPDVFNHNLETVPRLYHSVRPGSRYFASLNLLWRVKEVDPSIFTKSGLMVGLGESRDEIQQVMDDLREADVDFLTIGQYLQPSAHHHAIDRFWTPDEFKELETIAYAKGFLMVSASPLTRSSYHADADFAQMRANRIAQLDLMPTHAEQRALPYTPEQVFDLVAAVERYPEFLPWCTATRIKRREGDIFWADLAVGFKVFRETFTSKVTSNPSDRIDVEYLDGPFRYLNNHWKFLGQPDGTTVVDFYVDFEFRSRILQRAIGVLFEEAVRRMVGAFETRADALYGGKDGAGNLVAPTSVEGQSTYNHRKQRYETQR